MMEIDGVRDALHVPVSEAGDYVSDEYLLAIDLSTAPRGLMVGDTKRLASAIRRLNRNLNTTTFYLESEDPALVSVYNSVVEQVNDLNGSNENVDQLRPIDADTANRSRHTPNFQWA